jgi:hypothetical protein
MQNLIFNLVFSECKAWLVSKDDDMLDDDMIQVLVLLNNRGVKALFLEYMRISSMKTTTNLSSSGMKTEFIKYMK